VKDYWLGDNIGFGNGKDKVYDKCEQVMDEKVWLLEFNFDNSSKIVRFLKIKYKFYEI
jgi:hypothetical protein